MSVRVSRKELTALVLLAGSQVAMAINNGLGQTPAMGWNTWNKFGCDIDEGVIKSNA
jgi:alpha-galactosidase